MPSNKADAKELGLISFFYTNRDLKNIEGQLVKNGQAYYYFSMPIRVNDATLLECHDNQADAPDEQLDIYGEENG